MAHTLRVVPALREHHADFARLFAALELEDPVPDSERWAAEIAPWTFFLADGENLIAYSFTEILREMGYVRHIAVEASARGRGVGRALMRETARRLRAAGALRWELNVKRDNSTAIALYERCGMHTLYASDVVRVEWAALPRLPRSARPLLARPVEAQGDRAVEDAFRLPAGQLAHFRSTERMQLLQLIEHGEPVAFARFDPRFPGCFPFRVRVPELARPLLESVRPHARDDDPWIQLVIEDDAATTATLLAAGARRVLEIVHMGGPIPAQ